MRRAFAAVALVAALVAAGCLGGNPSEGLGDPALADDQLATVRGLVTSDELFPVPGAVVELESYPAVEANEDGVFEVRGVVPGRAYELHVNATGYEPGTLRLNVPRAGLVEVRVELEGIPGESPYRELWIFDGYEVCGYTAVYSASLVNPCPFGQRVSVHRVDIGNDWMLSIQELNWHTRDELVLASSHTNLGCRTTDPCAAMLWGPAPLKITARPNDAEYAAQYALDGEKTFPEGNFTNFMVAGYAGMYRQEIDGALNPVCVQINRQFNIPEHWGCPFGVGFSMGFRTNFYHATFYHALPVNPDTYTSIPDQ